MIKVITDATTKTGVGKYAFFLAEALSSELISMRKDNTKVLGDYGGRVFSGVRTGGLSTGYYLNERFPGLFFHQCYTYLNRESGDNMILHYSNPGIRKFNIKARSVVTFHDLFPLKIRSGDRTNKLKVKNFESFKGAEHMLTISNVMKSELEQSDFSGKIKVVYHPVSSTFVKLPETKEQLRKELNLPVNRKLILSISTNSPVKNLDIVDKTVKSLGDGYKLVRVGPPVSDSIVFNGVSEETLNRIYNACDALLMPSSEEGFGFPVIEAFATGLPVVVSDIDIFREITKGSAILSRIDPQTLKESLEEAIGNGEKYAEKGIKTAEFYSFENFRKNMVEYYAKELDVSF